MTVRVWRLRVRRARPPTYPRGPTRSRTPCAPRSVARSAARSTGLAGALAALAALAALVLLAKAPSVAAEPLPLPLPISTTESLLDQFGYAPDYQRHVPIFDSANRPVIRSRTASQHDTLYAAFLEGGVWRQSAFDAALHADLPRVRGLHGRRGLRLGPRRDRRRRTRLHGPDHPPHGRRLPQRHALLDGPRRDLGRRAPAVRREAALHGSGRPRKRRLRGADRGTPDRRATVHRRLARDQRLDRRRRHAERTVRDETILAGRYDRRARAHTRHLPLPRHGAERRWHLLRHDRGRQDLLHVDAGPQHPDARARRPTSVSTTTPPGR